MVPANYFEIFHDQDHDPTTYDTPKSARTTPIPPPHVDESLYDFPPTENDYDMPPIDKENQDYARPSSNRSSVKSNSTSIRLNRLSQTSAASSSSLYDVPPDLSDVYDFPKANSPLTRAFDEPIIAVDINSMYEDKAEELLSNYRQNISATYESLFQTVYGPDAYWGSDNKTRRSATLQKTVAATRHLDHSLRALLEFGKGVVNSLESSLDTNFKKKHTSAFRSLLEKRHDIMSKLESLNSEIDSITATVKSLLEVARTVPSAVTEFTVLVQANKSLLFKMSPKDTDTLPVITKNEAKARPLPDLPASVNERRDSLDYASIMTTSTSNGYAVAEITPDGPAGFKPDGTGSGKNSDESSLDFVSASRKRNPNDSLPPLPGATIPRRSRSSKKQSPDILPRVLSPLSSLRTDMRSPQPPRSRSRASDIDYDDIPEAAATHTPIRGNRPSTGSGASRGASPRPFQSLVRRQSLSSMSGSSDEMNGSGMRRCLSEDLLDGPYGRAVVPNGRNRSTSPQLPLRQEDRDLLQRFSKQMELIVPTVSESIDMFLDCLKDGEPPFDFVTKSKLTIVAAYKLVYIADALAQNILHNETKTAILASSNRLTESIKNLVSDTKTAALQYPSVIALDRVGESLRKLFPAALELVDSVKSPPTLV